MVSEINLRLGHKVAGVIIAVALCISLTTVFAFAARSEPIIISLASPFPTKAIIQTEYSMKVSWQNTNKKSPYNGHFLFIAEGKGFRIARTDIKFTFGGSTISPQRSDNCLYFHLPRQTFPAGKSGAISVQVVYYKPGDFSWQIGIVQ